MTPEELLALVGQEDIEIRHKLARGGRLVHYTSADAAYKILTGRQIWLRNAPLMNDFSEIAHGLRCVLAAWESPGGKALQEMLERIRSGLRNELAELFDGHAENLRYDTYLTSLSEHSDHEDNLGRLSMWRAYGGTTGVALILNSTPFVISTDAMKVYSAPVTYADENDFVVWFQAWAGKIVVNENAISKLDPEIVRNILFLMFRIFAMCTKHPGFSEEREWRVFSSPIHEGTSDWLSYDIETVGGVPQQIGKLKLFDDETRGIHGVAPEGLVNRVLIGPCEYPLQVRLAMREAMTHAGIGDPESKLWMSLIPLRHR